jgi:subtilisin
MPVSPSTSPLLRQTVRTLIALTVLGALLAPALGASASANTSSQPTSRHWSAGAYIVSLKAGVSVDEVAEQRVTARGGAVSQRYHTALNGFAADLSESAINELAADERVESIMPDFPVHASTQTTPTGIQRIQATSSSLAHIDGVDQRVDVDVAVLDTGSGPHADLNIAGGYNCTSANTGAYNDDNGHGTHVAGTVGAIDNGSGVVGVAPGARIWSIKVLNAAGTGSGSQIICGIDWVKQHAGTIEVANMSLGGAMTLADDHNCGYTNGDSIHTAICGAVAAGVTFAVAAGNDGKDAAGFFPALYDEVITVSALVDTDGKSGGLGQATDVGADDTLASFSNYGADVDVMAPGVWIYSTYLNSGFATMNGTSMAAPHVTGAAALYKVAHPSATPAQVRAALISSGSNANWSGDKDSTKEPLINVATFAAAGGDPAASMSVSSLMLSKTNLTSGYRLTATVSVKANGQNVAGALVTVKFTYPNGTTASASATTTSAGVATVQRSVTAKGAYTVEVTGISKAGKTYNAAGNAMTRKSLTIA